SKDQTARRLRPIRWPNISGIRIHSRHRDCTVLALGGVVIFTVRRLRGLIGADCYGRSVNIAWNGFSPLPTISRVATSTLGAHCAPGATARNSALTIFTHQRCKTMIQRTRRRLGGSALLTLALCTIALLAWRGNDESQLSS